MNALVRVAISWVMESTTRQTALSSMGIHYSAFHLFKSFKRHAVLLIHALLIPISNPANELILVPPRANEVFERLSILPVKPFLYS